MKKTIFSMIALAIAAISFTSCEDVPAPYDYPGTGGNGGETPGEALGNGTEADPFNCLAALNFTSALEADVESENDVYIKGKVVSVEEEFTTQFGNASFTISEDGTSKNTFKVWRAMYLGNKKFTNSDAQIQIGDEVIVCGKVVNFKGNTPETVQGKAYLYSLNGKKADGSSVPGEATGDGTEANPFNSVAANEIASKLASGENSPEYYIKGKVVSINEQYGTQFGNATFYISDDGTSANQFYVFRALYFNNKKYTSGTLLKEGDEVVIRGKITNFMGNTPETVQGEAYLYSLNGNKGDGGDKPAEGTPTGDGSEANPFNSVAANQVASALGKDEVSSQGYYIKGKVVSVKEQYGTQFGNATFYISDDGKADNQFCVFRALYLDNKKYTSGTLLQPGDDVVVYGKLTNYMGNTPETAQGEAYLVSLKSNGGGEEPGGGDEGDVSATNGDFETWVDGKPNNWKTASTAGNATLSQSTDAHGGKYSVQVGGTSSANKRIGYKEMQLKAGKYTMKFYAKAATASGASVRPGYVPVTDGKVGSYVYGEYTNNLKNNEWVLVTHEFYIESDGTFCLVIMNSKNPGADVLIDDFTLTKDGSVIIK